MIISLVQVKSWFPDWPNLEVRLDIWHFMRRLAACCSTNAHPMYATFMESLSRNLYAWDDEDMALLLQAKRAELRQDGVMDIEDDDLKHHVSKDELARHCKRTTRPVEEATELIQNMVDLFESDKAHDTLGVPLFIPGLLRDTWEKQKKHIKCIQDVPGISLYTEQPHRIKKGGIMLPVYKCARGSTSLEGFHNHLAKFIPGKRQQHSIVFNLCALSFPSICCL